MSISPNSDYDGTEDLHLDPGDSVIRMLDNILEDYKNVSPAEELKAIDLLDQAYETEDPDEAIERLLKALEHDPANVDVHLEFMDQSFLDEDFVIPVLERLKKIARKKLGEDIFTESAGQFWFLLETRPYMRVCHALASEYFLEAFYQKAINEWEDCLRLNPDDNLGVRDPLLMCYLGEKMHDKINTLFDQYQETGVSCCFSWGKVLHGCIQNDFDAAGASLKVAREQNKYVEGFIVGTRDYPDDIQDEYTRGSLGEAVMHAEMLTDAWHRFPEAVKWLKQQA